jgi:ATP-dependent Clp protease ATP-binding subunit ClpB
LSEKNIESIARIQLQSLEARLAKMDIRLDVSPAALAVVAQEGFDPVYGARPLKRAIQQQIENPLATEILKGNFAPGETVHVAAKGGKLSFVKR